MLGWVDVHIHSVLRHIQVQHEHRMTPMKHDIAVSLAYRMTHHLVADGASIHVEVLLVRYPPVMLR